MFDFDDENHPIDPIWFYLNEYCNHVLMGCLQNDKPPQPSDWKQDVINSMAVSVDKARADVFHQAKQEFSFIKQKINNVLQSPTPTLMELAIYFFGKDSDLFNVFQRRFKNYRISHQTFCKCIGWFLLICRYSEDDDELRAMYDQLSLPSPKEYKLFWSGINRCNLYESINNRINPTTPLWRHIESTVNETLKELFINEFPGQKVVTIDDDKVFFEAKKTPYHFEPKQTQHVKDNRRGPVIDTAGYTSSGVPIGFRCQGFKDNTASNTENLISGQFAATDVHITINFDRGYSIWSTIKYFLGRGAILGAATERRSPWFPFSFDQKLRKGDERQDIATNGPKIIHSKRYTFKARESEAVQISAIGYRNGNGGVILGMTSDPELLVTNGQFKMDIVLKNPSDYNWYHSINVNDLNQKWFSSIVSEHLESLLEENIDFLNHLLSIVQPVTSSPNNPIWFVCRCYSLTSSTTDRVISFILRPHVKQQLQETIKYFNQNTACLQRIEAYINHFIEEDVLTNLDGNEQNSSSVIKYRLAKMNDDERLVNELRDSIVNNVIGDDTVKSFLKELGGGTGGKKESRKNKLLNWTKAAKERRPYILKEKEWLIKEIRRRKAFNGDCSSKSHDALVAILIANDKNGELE